MALASQPVKAFLDDSYQLISSSSPTVPLQGNDQNKALQFLNELVSFYSATGLLLTIAQKIHIDVQIGQQFVTFADPAYLPTANVPLGRLANCQNVWLELDGVTYPMYIEDRNTFFSSYKYFPLQGLPRFAIITNDLNLTTMQIYPSPSQQFDLWVYGKFEMSSLTATMDMSGFPAYELRFLRWALARELAYYKGRASAWTPDLQGMYDEARLEIQAVSPVNLNVESDYESLLNGSWRIRSGV